MKFKQNNRHLIKTMTDPAHAGVRTDRPERSYQELFSAAKEMYQVTDTRVTIPYPALCGNAHIKLDINTVYYCITSLSTH